MLTSQSRLSHRSCGEPATETVAARNMSNINCAAYASPFSPGLSSSFVKQTCFGYLFVGGGYRIFEVHSLVVSATPHRFQFRPKNEKRSISRHSGYGLSKTVLLYYKCKISRCNHTSVYCITALLASDERERSNHSI